MLTCEAIWDPHILRRASVLRIGKHRPELSIQSKASDFLAPAAFAVPCKSLGGASPKSFVCPDVEKGL